ncbi:hypothetical protein [Bacteroides nordii]|uniref:hypothetical protein n=1 Tax=Bacteroides nordii TaxID=291645 RepID=UPI00249089E1|nr:hypothetical protein [Bacteroides nordii]
MKNPISPHLQSRFFVRNPAPRHLQGAFPQGNSILHLLHPRFSRKKLHFTNLLNRKIRQYRILCRPVVSAYQKKNSPEEREALKSIIDGMHGIVEQTKKD